MSSVYSYQTRVLVALSLLVVLFSGCGSSAGDEDLAFTGRDASVPGSIVFNFVRAQTALQVPADTVRLLFELHQGPDGSGQLLRQETRDFAATITLQNVDPTVRSVVVKALNQNRVTSQATVNVVVVAGGEIVVDFAGINLVPVANVAPLLALDPSGAGQFPIDQDAAGVLTPFARTTFTDNDQTDLRGGTLTVSSTTITDLVYAAPGAPVLGTLAGGGTSVLTVNLDENATPLNIQTFLRAVTVSSSTGSSLGEGTLNVTVTDGYGGSASDARSVFVIPANALFLSVGAGQTFPSLGAAVAEVAGFGAPGSVITVAPGDYTGEGTITLSNDTDLQNTVLRGPSAGHSAGSNPSNGRAANGALVQAIRVDSPNVTIDGFDFTNSSQEILINDGAAGLVVSNNTFTSTSNNNTFGIRFESGSGGLLPNNLTITNNLFTGWHMGLRLSGEPAPGFLQNVTITGNAFVQNTFGTVLLDIDNPTFTFEQNGFFNQAANHLRFDRSPPGTLTVRNNEFSGTGLVQAMGPPANTLDAQMNWWGDPAGAQPGQTGGIGAVDTSNPLTVDPLPNFP